jgi:hypothetical protein
MVNLYIPSILFPLFDDFLESGDVVRHAGMRYFKASNSRLILILLLFSIIECNCFVSCLRFANSSESTFADDLRLFFLVVVLAGDEQLSFDFGFVYSLVRIS